MAGIFDMISSFFSPEKGYEKAGDEWRKAWEESQGYQRPYWQQGLDQYGKLTGAQGELLDPTGLLDKWISKYSMSPYAKQMQAEAQEKGLGAASSMGLTGSSAALSNIQKGASEIMNKDRQQFLNDLMQKYLAGIGIGQNIYGIGAQTGRSLGEQGMQYGRGAAEMAYGAENAPGNLLERLLSMGANVAGNYFTGGASGALAA